MDTMLKSALFYHNEGLCVIPIVPRDKRPALPSWEQYQTTRSTAAEVNDWFTSQPYNIGIIHGPVSGGYIAIDIDHDAGIFGQLRDKWPVLFSGRVEQSGSGEGYHIPLFVDTIPDFGFDDVKKRPRGNKTWKTKAGIVNIRAQFCQTVAPPSIHPTGRRYKFIQKGNIARVKSLADLTDWLQPQDIRPQKTVTTHTGPVITPDGNDLKAAVVSAYSSVLQVFAEFGLLHEVEEEPGGGLRLLGNGGLLVKEDQQTWYNFSDEIGGGIFEAWGWCRFGTGYDKHKHFRQVLTEMAQAKNIDTTDLVKPAEAKPARVVTGNTRLWAGQFGGYWAKAR